MMEGLPHQLVSFKHAVLMLPIAALLGGALGVIRPIRRSLVSRSSHMIQAQVLLAIVGAVVMIIVADSLARAFAIAGAAPSAIQTASEIRTLAELERDYIAAALRASGGNRAKAAQRLGIGAATLYRKLKQERP